MKYLNDIFTIFLLLVVILKIIDFNNLSWLDILIIVLFIVSGILSAVKMKRKEK